MASKGLPAVDARNIGRLAVHRQRPLRNCPALAACRGLPAGAHSGSPHQAGSLPDSFTAASASKTGLWRRTLLDQFLRDIFSVLLYELLTGHRPFNGDTPAATFDAILHDLPAPVTDCAATLPPALAHLISRALEKDRAQRWQTPPELRAALQSLQQALEFTAQSARQVEIARLLTRAVPLLQP